MLDRVVSNWDLRTLSYPIRAERVEEERSMVIIIIKLKG